MKILQLPLILLVSFTAANASAESSFFEYFRKITQNPQTQSLTTIRISPEQLKKIPRQDLYPWTPPKTNFSLCPYPEPNGVSQVVAAFCDRASECGISGTKAGSDPELVRSSCLAHFNGEGSSSNIDKIWDELGMDEGNTGGLSASEVKQLICSGIVTVNPDELRTCLGHIPTLSCDQIRNATSLSLWGNSEELFPEDGNPCSNVLSGPTSPVEVGCQEVHVTCNCGSIREFDEDTARMFSLPTGSAPICASFSRIASAFDDSSEAMAACNESGYPYGCTATQTCIDPCLNIDSNFR